MSKNSGYVRVRVLPIQKLKQLECSRFINQVVDVPINETFARETGNTISEVSIIFTLFKAGRGCLMKKRILIILVNLEIFAIRDEILKSRDFFLSRNPKSRNREFDPETNLIFL